MTRSRALLLTLMIFTAACGGKSTTSPSTNSSSSTTVFTAQLLPANERPNPITNADVSGSGNVTVTVAATKDASGAITSANVTFQVNLTNFPANTTLTGAHIHIGDANTAGAVVINTFLANGEIQLGNGTGGFTKVTTGADIATVQGMINNPAGFYFNVHTSINTGGAARGQLVKQ